MNKFNLSFLLLLTTFFLTDVLYAQIRFTPVASVTDGSTYPELDGVQAITTVVINENTYALVAAYLDDGVQIIDISDPTSPTATASVADGIDGFDELGYPTAITTVVINGSTYALVAAYIDDGVQIIDISDPTSPTATASVTDGSGGFNKLDGTRAITTVVINGSTYALVAAYDDDGVQIIDISNPASPTATASVTDGSGGFNELDGARGITTVVIDGSTYALVAAYIDDGVQIIDISNPASPTAKASVTDGSTYTELDGARGITTVVINGITYALVASYHDDGVQIIDISNPASLSAVADITDGSTYPELDGARAITTVVINGSTYALVASYEDDGVQVIDITNPASPTATTSVTDGVGGFEELSRAYEITSVAISGSTYALVAAYNDDGIQIMELVTQSTISSIKKSLTINANDNAEWSTEFDKEMNLPSVEQFLATKALRVGTAANIVTQSSGELLSIRYGETNGSEDKSILVFEIDVPFDEETYLIRMQYGDTGYDNSGLTDIENGLALYSMDEANGTLDTRRPPVISSSNSFSVAENTAVGTTIFTVQASDADDAGDTMAYTLTNDASGVFSIDSTTGAIVLASALDYETTTSYTIEVTVADNDGTPATTSQTITVSVTNVDEEVPVITSGSTATIAENIGAAQVVYTVTATDDIGVISYGLSGTDADDFSIDTTTGAVTLTANPDYETKSSYSFDVTASDAAGHSSAATTVTLTITDVDDEVLPVITSGTTATIAENSGASQVVYTITATDNVGVTGYGLGGTDASHFSIDTTTGEVTLTADPDYETKNSYSFDVTASDAAGNTSAATTVTLTVTDVADETPPSITSTKFGLTYNSDGNAEWTSRYSEAMALPTIAGFLATKALRVGSSTNIVTVSSGKLLGISYGQTNGVEDKRNLVFEIDVPENNSNYQLRMQYGSAGHDNSGLTDLAGNALDQVTNAANGYLDTTNMPPAINSGNSFSVAESATVGATLFTVLASDGNSGQTLTYALSNNASGVFSIGSATGEITLASALDYETTTSYTIEVTVTDNGGTPKSSSQTITVSVTNVDDEVPVITSGATATIAENSGENQLVYTVIATDDVGVTSYGLGGTDADDFSIDTTTGAVTLTADPDYETKISYSFAVTASDAAGHSSAATTVALTVTNVDDEVPVITSGATATIAENSGENQLVYTVTATDDVGVTSYGLGGTDADDFSIDTTTGKVTLTADPDYETKISYSFAVTASDAAGHSSAATTVALTVTNVDDEVPVITSGATATIAENSGENQLVYTVTATDDVGVTSYGLGGTDADDFSIDTTTGAVTLTADPDYETKISYSFDVTASDAAGHSSAATTVTLTVTNVDDEVPVITSGATATIAENSGENQVVYTVTATDDVGVTSYGLGGTDADDFSIDTTTGKVTLTADPDYETKISYSFAVTASDAAGHSSAATTVALTVTNVDDEVPVITSGATATIAENSGENQVVYTVTATDDVGVTSYGLGGTDADDFSIDTTTGKVTLTADPDYETKISYSFAVTASDAAGHSSAATTVTLTVTDVADEAPPSVDAAELSTSDSDTITLTMSETVVDDSVTASDFTVSGGTNTPTVSSVAVSGVTLTLTLSEDLSFTDGATITLSYTQSSGYIKDDAGNALANFSNQSVDTGTFSLEVPEIFSLEYTNPVRNSVEIRSSQLMRGLSIYNLSGQKVYTANLNRHSTRLELSHLSQGIYLMRVFTNDAEKMLKLIKL